MADTLTNCKLYIAEFDLSGDMNALALQYGAEAKDGTTFGQTTQINKGGLKSLEFQHEGLWSAETDKTLFSQVGTEGLSTIAPQTGAEGEPAYFGQVVSLSYEIGAEQGELFPVSIGGNGADTFNRGTIIKTGSIVNSGVGTGYQLGAAEMIYAGMHVLDASGTAPTLDVEIESDVDDSFSSPITQASFTQATEETSEWIEVEQSVSDTWWRAKWTVGGTNPDFNIILVLAIR